MPKRKPEWRAEHYFKLINLLTEAIKKERGLEIADPYNVNNPYTREVQRYRKMIELVENFFEFDIYCHNGGTVIIKDKYIVSLRSPKYRIKGKGEWYTYRKSQKLYDIMNERTGSLS
jgi:hypothetical protein